MTDDRTDSSHAIAHIALCMCVAYALRSKNRFPPACEIEASYLSSVPRTWITGQSNNDALRHQTWTSNHRDRWKFRTGQRRTGKFRTGQWRTGQQQKGYTGCKLNNIGHSSCAHLIECNLLLTLCGLTSQKNNQRGIGLSGSVHAEAHPCFPNFV